MPETASIVPAEDNSVVEYCTVEEHLDRLHALRNINPTAGPREIEVLHHSSGIGGSIVCRMIDQLETIDNGETLVDSVTKAISTQGIQLNTSSNYQNNVAGEFRTSRGDL